MSVDSAVQDLLKRLETVTARLESVEGQLAAGAGGSPAGAAPATGSAPVAGAGAGDAPAVAAYQALIDEHIKPYVEASNTIGGEVAEQAAIVLDAINSQKQFLETASQCKKPSPEGLQPLIAETSRLMGEAGEIREKNRGHKDFNNLSAISEGISALGWVVVEPTPGPYVNESRGSSEFYSNKLLMAHKNSDAAEDKNQIAWVQGWNGFLKALFTYIKDHHTTGVTWNPNGQDASSFTPSAPAKKEEAPAQKEEATPAKPAAGKGLGASLFSEINAVGAGQKPTLKKVTKDMKTKNQTDKSSVVKAAPAKAKAVAPTKPPKLELSGNKWEIEYQVNNNNIVIEDTKPAHVLYLFKCERSVVQVKGKVNNITLDNCKRVSLVFDTAIAALECVNCQSLEIQCTNTCPTYTVDSTSGFQLFLGAEGLECEITQSKSSEINIMIPGASEEDDLIELNVPDQFKTTIVDNRVKTEEVVHV